MTVCWSILIRGKVVPARSAGAGCLAAVWVGALSLLAPFWVPPVAEATSDESVASQVVQECLRRELALQEGTFAFRLEYRERDGTLAQSVPCTLEVAEGGRHRLRAGPEKRLVSVSDGRFKHVAEPLLAPMQSPGLSDEDYGFYAEQDARFFFSFIWPIGSSTMTLPLEGRTGKLPWEPHMHDNARTPWDFLRRNWKVESSEMPPEAEGDVAVELTSVPVLVVLGADGLAEEFPEPTFAHVYTIDRENAIPRSQWFSFEGSPYEETFRWNGTAMVDGIAVALEMETPMMDGRTLTWVLEPEHSTLTPPDSSAFRVPLHAIIDELALVPTLVMIALLNGAVALIVLGVWLLLRRRRTRSGIMTTPR